MAQLGATVVNSSIGSHGIDTLVNAASGAATVIVRASSAGMLIGGANLNYEVGLGGGGNPASAGYALTANQEYQFTVGAQTQVGSGSDAYSVYIYNSTGGSVSYSVIVIAA